MKLRGKSNFSTDYGKSNDPDGVPSYYRRFFEFFRSEARSIFRFQFFFFFFFDYTKISHITFFFFPCFFTKLFQFLLYTLVEYELDDRYRFHKLTVPSRRYRNEDTFHARSSTAFLPPSQRQRFVLLTSIPEEASIDPLCSAKFPQPSVACSRIKCLNLQWAGGKRMR